MGVLGAFLEGGVWGFVGGVWGVGVCGGHGDLKGGFEGAFGGDEGDVGLGAIGGAFRGALWGCGVLGGCLRGL